MLIALGAVVSLAPIARGQTADDPFYTPPLAQPADADAGEDDNDLDAQLDAALREAEPWTIRREYRRPVHLPDRLTPDQRHTVVIAFESGGRLTAAARSIVVADANGGVLRSEVLHVDRHGLTWVAFDARSASGSIWLYYGGTGSPPQPADYVGDAQWSARLSVAVVTAPAGGSGLNNPDAIRQAARRSPQGFMMTNQVFMGHNPFGDDDRYVTWVRAVLKAPQPGAYRLYVNADEAAFVLLDGELILARPGPARLDRSEPTTTATVSLSGEHVIEVLHAEDRGPQGLILGWTPPGREGFPPIPASAFPRTPQAEAGPPERAENRPVAAFQWRLVDQMSLENAVYSRITFDDLSRNLPPGAQRQWRFGTAFERVGGARPFIHLGEDPLEVRLTILDDQGRPLDVYETRIPIGIGPAASVNNRDHLLAYVDAIVGMPMSDRVTPAQWEAYWELVSMVEQSARVLPFVEALAARTGVTRAAWSVSDRMAHGLSVTDPPRAIELYDQIASLAPTELDRARVEMERIELVLHKLNDPDRARRLAIQARNRGGPASLLGRIAAVKLGDIHRTAGAFDLAAAAYRDATDRAQASMDPREQGVRQSAYLETVQAMIREGRLRDARAELVTWEADFPMGKLSGEQILMTAAYFQALGDHRRAIAELRTVIELNPLSPFTPEVQRRLAISQFALGDVEAARKTRDHLVVTYPHSDAARLGRRIPIPGPQPEAPRARPDTPRAQPDPPLSQPDETPDETPQAPLELDRTIFR